MRDLAQELGRVALLLQRIAVARFTDNFDLFGDNFPALTFALRCDECAFYPNGSTGNEALHRGIIWQRVFCDDLQVPQAGTVVQFDE